MTSSNSFIHDDFRKQDTNEWWENLKTEYYKTWGIQDCIIQGNGKESIQAIFIDKKELKTLLKIASKREKKGFQI